MKTATLASVAPSRTITAPRHGRKGNKWCGPAAISILTGCTTDAAEIVIKANRASRAAVKGTTTLEVDCALRKFGFRLDRFHTDIYYGRTVAAFVDGRINGLRIDPTCAYLIEAAEHWQVVQGKHFADNRGLRRTDDATFRRGRIVRVHRVVRFALVADFARVERAARELLAERTRR